MVISIIEYFLLTTSHTLSLLFLIGRHYSFHLQNRKLRHRVAKQLTQGHTAKTELEFKPKWSDSFTTVYINSNSFGSGLKDKLWMETQHQWKPMTAIPIDQTKDDGIFRLGKQALGWIDEPSFWDEKNRTWWTNSM